MKRPDMNKDTSKMNLDEIRAYNRELMAYRRYLLDQRRAEQETATTPEPAPVVEEAANYKVTASQRRALARFDDLSDGEQVDALSRLWGQP
jgi:Mg2+ and Co2+ transporter CorA